MKKIISIILALTCVFAMFSCEKELTLEEQIATVADMYAVSAPTKIVTETTQTIGTTPFEGYYELKTGKIDGKLVTVAEWSYYNLDTIENGAGGYIKDYGSKVTGTKEYHEDLGVRNNGGKWFDGYNFAPAAGDIALDLTFANLTDPVYEANKLTFTVKADKIEDVFGEDTDITSDASVEITYDGAVVNGMTVSYVIEADGDYPEIKVTIKNTYTYGIEEITLE